MNPDDLAELDRLLASASAVVAMQDVHEGAVGDDVIGLRHDVDDNAGSLETAVKMAAWESRRGYRSTYFILHTARYWQDERRLTAALDHIAGHGHEIGIHANALTVALTDGGDPHEILAAAIDQLRSYGYRVDGIAGHGDQLCRVVGYVNDEIFAECGRPEMGAPDRVLSHDGRSVRLEPRPLASHGLIYETYRLPHGRYLSDSGGTWNIPLADVPAGPGQLHILQHPDWWSKAF